jgi:hypothetical protein
MPLLKYAIPFFISIALSCTCAHAEQRTTLTKKEIKILKSVGCKKDNFKFENGRLIFGHRDGEDESDSDRILLFLIKNISPNDVVLDFPEGQMGAAATISQYIKKDEWTAYLYVPGKDILHTTRGDRKTKWTCNNAIYNPGKNKSECENNLYICNVTNVSSKNSPLKSNIKYITDHADKSWWALISSPENSNSTDDIEDLFRIWRNATRDRD